VVPASFFGEFRVGVWFDCASERGDGIDDVVLEHVHQGVVMLALWEQLGRTFRRPNSSRLQCAIEPRPAHADIVLLGPLRSACADGDKMLHEAVFG